MKASHLWKSGALRAMAPIALVAGSLMGVHGSAAALTTEHGSNCKPYGNSATSGLYSYISGAYNYSGGSMGVACPVVRTAAAPSTGYSVWVDGSASTGTTSCTMYSYNYTGAYLGSISFSATGVFDRLLTLPASQVPTYSSQVVYCYVPANGSLYDVEPVQ
ncbi:MAG TPA: hypothetical protein VF457_12120 [Burkholderiaceae bacterium]